VNAAAPLYCPPLRSPDNCIVVDGRTVSTMVVASAAFRFVSVQLLISLPWVKNSYVPSRVASNIMGLVTKAPNGFAAVVYLIQSPVPFTRYHR